MASYENYSYPSRTQHFLGLHRKLDISVGLDEMHPVVLKQIPNVIVKSFYIIIERLWLSVEKRYVTSTFKVER